MQTNHDPLAALLAWPIALVLIVAVGHMPLADERHRQAEQDRAAAARATIAANARGWLAWQQLKCGPEAGHRKSRDGAIDCTDKHGRRTGVQIAGARP